MLSPQERIQDLKRGRGEFGGSPPNFWGILGQFMGGRAPPPLAARLVTGGLPNANQFSTM